MASARFSKSFLYDADRMVVMFNATVGTKQIPCAISVEALQDHFQHRHTRDKVITTVTLHRAAIERIAARLIEQNRFEPDGSILIRTEDCAR